MTDETKKSNANKKIVNAIVIGIALCIAYALWSDDSRNTELKATKDPARLAYLVLDYRDEDFKSSATEFGNEITVKFNLGKYSPASEITFLDEARYIYQSFSNNFKNKDVTVVGTASFIDVKGNESRDNAFEISFTSDQAKTINWSNVKYGDLPQLAQKYWKSPR
jgi:Asp-tRNA(Asn)/Glu-tRNA(Gln) amidotransferase A subunit family amidase